MNKVEFRGQWWIPEDYENRVGGVVQYKPESGIRLELFESLFDGFEDFKTVERILGISDDNEKITLQKCNRVSYQMNFGGETSTGNSAYSARRMVSGDYWYSNKNNISFEKLMVSFPLVDEWSGLSNPARAEIDPPEGGPGSTATITSILPDDTPEKTVPEFNVEIYPKSSVRPTRHGDGTIEINQHFVLTIRRPDVPFKDCLEYVKMLRDLVAFGTGETVYPKYVKGKRNSDDSNESYLDLYFSSSNYEKDGKHPSKMTFLAGDVDGGFEELIDTWYHLRLDLKPVLDSYVGVLYNESMYMQDKFLSIMRCLEGYYLRRHNNTYVSEKKWELIAEHLEDMIDGDIPEIYDNNGMVAGDISTYTSIENMKNLNEAYNIDNDLINKLSSMFKYANKHSLNRIIKTLIRKYESIIESVRHNPIGNERKIVLTRNYYTHQKSTKSDMVVEGANLVELTWGVQQLLEAILLDEIGISDGQIQEKLERKYKIRELS